MKKEGRKKSTTVEKTAPKDGRSDKVASLLFTATLETEQGELVQSIQSRPISLSKLMIIYNNIIIVLVMMMMMMNFCIVILQPQHPNPQSWTGWNLTVVTLPDKSHWSSKDQR